MQNRQYIGMRRFFVVLFLLTATLAFFVYQDTERDRSLSDKLERMMNAAAMDIYREPFYGYTVHYPSFFEKIQGEKGTCKFRYGSMKQVIQTASVSLNLDSLTVRQGMERFAAELHATGQCCGSDSFILSGPLHVGDRPIEGYRFHAKYVKRQKLWFVQHLTYPESYSRAVARLIKQIDGWTAWEEVGECQS